MRTLLALLILTTTATSFALNSQAKPEKHSNLSSCPQINQLYLDPKTHFWSAPGGWKTFSVSFAIKANHFLGAQWEGTNVGALYCLYQGIALGNKQTFNIQLQHPGLIDQPSGGKWTKNLGGYQNCISSKQSDCLFKAYTQKKSGNMYQTLDSLKTLTPQQIGY